MDKEFAIDGDDHLQDLVSRAETGETLALTVGGKVVATLTPTGGEHARQSSIAAVKRILEIGKDISFDGIPIKELTHGGHKY